MLINTFTILEPLKDTMSPYRFEVFYDMFLLNQTRGKRENYRFS